MLENVKIFDSLGSFKSDSGDGVVEDEREGSRGEEKLEVFSLENDECIFEAVRFVIKCSSSFKLQRINLDSRRNSSRKRGSNKMDTNDSFLGTIFIPSTHELFFLSRSLFSSGDSETGN